MQIQGIISRRKISFVESDLEVSEVAVLKLVRLSISVINDSANIFR